MRVYNYFMGNCLDSCLKHQINKGGQFVQDPTGSSLMMFKHRYKDQQVVFSDTLLQIQSKSLSKIQADTLIAFADTTSSLLQNPFIQNLGVSQVTNLQSKIADVTRIKKYEKQFEIIIQNPFHGIPIKKLIIFQLKIWDGNVHQLQYLKSTVRKAVESCSRRSGRVRIGVLEIQTDSGYNLKDFYKILMLKIRESKDKFYSITYITQKKQQIQKFLLQDLPQILTTEQMDESQKSNYY